MCIIKEKIKQECYSKENTSGSSSISCTQSRAALISSSFCRYLGGGALYILQSLIGLSAVTSMGLLSGSVTCWLESMVLFFLTREVVEVE